MLLRRTKKALLCPIEKTKIHDKKTLFYLPKKYEPKAKKRIIQHHKKEFFLVDSPSK